MEPIILHSIWLLPFVTDSVLIRYCFLPNLVTRNRNVVMQVSSEKTLDEQMSHLDANECSGIKGNDAHLAAQSNQEHPPMLKNLEDDAAIQGMNGIYITAIGSKKEINSDNVFYTPHIDGPYWWLPGASSW